MSDLVARLTQLLDEDEQAARDALDVSNAHIPTGNGYLVQYVWSRQLLLDGKFQTAWTMPGAPTPSQVLADVAAKKAVTDLHERLSEEPGDRVCTTCPEVYPCATLRLLASAYADRPGYDGSWRP